MDPKKQDLTPEMKQIYDRVMNTQVNKPQTPPSVSQTQPASPLSELNTSQLSTPPIPESQSTTAPQEAIQTPPVSPATPTAQAAPDSSSESEAFLSSVPPRPVTDNQSFAFSNNKVTTGTSSAPAPQVSNTSQKKFSTPVIAFGMIVLVVVWAVVWAKIFGLF